MATSSSVPRSPGPTVTTPATFTRVPTAWRRAAAMDSRSTSVSVGELAGVLVGDGDGVFAEGCGDAVGDMDGDGQPSTTANTDPCSVASIL